MKTSLNNKSNLKKWVLAAVTIGMVSGFTLSAEAAVWKGNNCWKFGDAATTTVISEGNYAIDSPSDTIVLDACYQAGDNSKLVLGASEQAAEAKFAKTGLTWGAGDGEISSAVYIAKSVRLDDHSQISSHPFSQAMKVSDTPHYVLLLGKTLLMVDAKLVKEHYAITNVSGMTTHNLGNNATRLYIDGAKKGETYKLFEGEITDINALDAYGNHAATDFRGFNLDFVSSDNSLLKFIDVPDYVDEHGYEHYYGRYHVIAQTQSVNEAFGAGKVIAPNAYDETVENKNDGDVVYDFVMFAVDSHVNGPKTVQISALNSAAALGEVAGTAHGTYTASHLLTDGVADHLSLASRKTNDKDLWAHYIHAKENVNGLSIANFSADYDAQYNGIVVGTDLYQKGPATFGAALTYVDGDSNGHTLAAQTKNDATYYGMSLYGRIAKEDRALIGDISYLHGKNDITQHNSGETLTAKAKTDTFSIGLRAEKSFQVGKGKWVPYAGFRYMHLSAGDYTNSIGMHYDGDDMNLWMLPIGVTYSTEVKRGGWTFRPMAEIGYVWNLGDRNGTETVSLNGASDSFGFAVADSGSYLGRLKIEAQKANITYGIGYEYQKGNTTKANRWTANVNWRF